MSRDIIILKGVQLAYARAIAAIELRFPPPSREFSENYDDEESAYSKAQAIVAQLERDGDLRATSMWRQRVPLIDLYDFSEAERDLLLDLDEAGGIQITRRSDGRFRSLGCGQSGKCAVIESYQTRHKVELTERGKALVEAIKAGA